MGFVFSPEVGLLGGVLTDLPPSLALIRSRNTLGDRFRSGPAALGRSRNYFLDDREKRAHDFRLQIAPVCQEKIEAGRSCGHLFEDDFFARILQRSGEECHAKSAFD